MVASDFDVFTVGVSHEDVKEYFSGPCPTGTIEDPIPLVWDMSNAAEIGREELGLSASARRYKLSEGKLEGGTTSGQALMGGCCSECTTSPR